MRVTNRQIAEMFNEIADLLDIDGENPFRVRAYRNAARTILSYPRSMAELVEEGFDLSQLRGIGKELAKKIAEIVTTGRLRYLERLKRSHPPQLEALLKIPGLGPGRVRLLHEMLHINSIKYLEQALENGKLDKVPGFGPKLIEKIANGVKRHRYEEKRFRIDEAEETAMWLKERLLKASGVQEISVAGSIRRCKETVHDIDMVASATEGSDIMARFTSLPEVSRVIMQGTTRSSVRLSNGMAVDLRVVDDRSYGATLHHFTGSKAHNIALRKMAKERGMKINEYGIFHGDERLGGETEGDVYRLLEMDYIQPEMRENRGEIAKAQTHTLPHLIEPKDIRGDLHMHTLYSDGMETIETMAKAAQAKGYEYIAITDHTKHLTIAHGLDEKRLREQLEEIDRINEKMDGITLFKSAEVDILEDGSLDLPDDILNALDLVVCAVHFKFDLSKQKQTARILKAMEHPAFTILAHPTGRLINLREPYAVDMEKVMEAAKERGCFMELNAQPDRLDLNDRHCRLAKEVGVPVVISTDAHSPKDLNLMHYGIGQARRGWLEKEDVLNTRSLAELQKLLKQIRP